MTHGQAAQGPTLIGALGVGSLLGEIPRIFLDLYKMRRDGSFYDQQDYLAKLRSQEAKEDVSLRLMTEEQAEHRHRVIENSPFNRPPDEARQLVLAETEGGREPALLIAPFARDPAAADKSVYRLAISASWQRAPWRSYLKSIDGLIVRPLHHGDVDLHAIREELYDIPVVLIHGGIQADRRVWPEIVAWNLISEPPQQSRQRDPRALPPALRISLPMIEVPRSSERDAVTAELKVQDQLAQLCILVVGMLGDWFRTIRSGQTPALYTLLSAVDDRRLAARGGVGALDLAVEWRRIDAATALVRQAQMCADVGLLNLSVYYIDKAIASLKASIDDDPALQTELRRSVVGVYNMVVAKAPADLSGDEQPGIAARRDEDISELRDWLWHRTMGGFGWDDPASGGCP